MNIVDVVPVTIKVRGIDLIALKKLSLVSHALASKLSFSASEEQKTLATVLDDIIRQIEVAAATRESGSKNEAR